MCSFIAGKNHDLLRFGMPPASMTQSSWSRVGDDLLRKCAHYTFASKGSKKIEEYLAIGPNDILILAMLQR
jgi:hypothetical protein